MYLGRANGTTCWWAECWTEGRGRAGDRAVDFGLNHHKRKKFGVKTKNVFESLLQDRHFPLSINDPHLLNFLFLFSSHSN